MNLDEKIQTLVSEIQAYQPYVGDEILAKHIETLSWLKELKEYREMFKTRDGIYVKPDDKVYVFSSTGKVS